MTCEYCNNSFKKGNKCTVEHVNVSQSTRKHSFCSQACKDSWVFQLQKRNSRVIVAWAIGFYSDRYFFVKNLLKVSDPSLLGSKGNKSRFIPNLSVIKTLVLVESNGRRMLKVKA